MRTGALHAVPHPPAFLVPLLFLFLYCQVTKVLAPIWVERKFGYSCRVNTFRRSIPIKIRHSSVTTSYYSVVSSFRSAVSWFCGLQTANVIGYDAVTRRLTCTMYVPLFTGLNLIGYDSNPYYLKSYIKPVLYIYPVQSYIPIKNLELDSGSLISSLFQRFAACSANQ